MSKSLLPVLLLTIFAAGCASLKPTQPLPPSCPAPLQLPPLPPPPSKLEQSFLWELETILFRSRSEPTNYELSSKPATEPTTQPGLGLKR